MSNKIDELSKNWIELKKIEQESQEARRAIEDELVKFLKINETDKGTKTEKTEWHVIKITCRLDKKVNSEAIIELASEFDLKNHLERLFRWKAEVNEMAWKNADKRITDILERGITSKPGRPSFSITNKEEI